MTQNDGDGSNEEAIPRKSKRHDKIIAYVAVACFLLAAVDISRRYLFSGSGTFQEVRVGSSVTRIPAPAGARPHASESSGGEKTQVSFATVGGEEKETVGYYFSAVDGENETFTAERFSASVAQARREFSSLGTMLRMEFVKQAIFQRADIPLKRVDVRQYVENDALVMAVKGTSEEFGITRYVNCAQLFFLFRDRRYLITVIVFSPPGLFRDALREAWMWHGAILAAN